jgi:hypothetical protein
MVYEAEEYAIADLEVRTLVTEITWRQAFCLQILSSCLIKTSGANISKS